VLSTAFIAIARTSFLSGEARSWRDAPFAPLAEDRKDIWDYYKLVFMKDGYPGKKTEQGIIPHPMYGAYVAEDYIREFNRTGLDVYKVGLVNVLNATLLHMSKDKDGSLIFYYEPEWNLVMFPRRFYSGLAQARYLRLFYKAFEISGNNEFKKAAKSILLSLKKPVGSAGGGGGYCWIPKLARLLKNTPTMFQLMF
jgi:hypothetical protein